MVAERMVIETRTLSQAPMAAGVASVAEPRARVEEAERRTQPRGRDRARRSAILALGTAVPGAGYPQARLVEFMKRAHRADARLARRLEFLYRHSGIETRHSCLEDYDRSPADFTFYPRDWDAPPPTTRDRMAVYRRAGLPLARAAVASALDRLPGFDRTRISHLVVASCTGFNAPGLDVDLIASLGLRRSVARTLVGFQGCHAGLTCLRLADEISRADEDALVLTAAEAGADDVELDGSSFVVTSAPEVVTPVRQALDAAGFAVESVDLAMVPKTTVAVSDESTARRIMNLVEGLEETEDVQDVYANFDIPEAVLEAVAS